MKLVSYISYIYLFVSISLAYSSSTDFDFCGVFHHSKTAEEITCFEKQGREKFLQEFGDMKNYSDKVVFLKKMQDGALEQLERQIGLANFVRYCFEQYINLEESELQSDCVEAVRLINMTVKEFSPGLRSSLFKASMGVRELGWESILNYQDFLGDMYPWPSLMVGEDPPRRYTKYELDNYILPELKKDFAAHVKENFKPSWSDLGLSKSTLKKEDIKRSPLATCLVDGIDRKKPNYNKVCDPYYKQLAYEINYIFPAYAKEVELKESANLSLFIQTYPYLAYLNNPQIPFHQFKNDKGIQETTHKILGKYNVSYKNMDEKVLYELLINVSTHKMTPKNVLLKLNKLESLSKETKDFLKNTSKDQKDLLDNLARASMDPKLRELYSKDDVLSAIDKTIKKAQELKEHISKLDNLDEDEMIDVMAFDGLSQSILINFPQFCGVYEELNQAYIDKNDSSLSEMASTAGTVATCLLSRFKFCFAVGAFSSAKSFFNARQAADREGNKVHSLFKSPLNSVSEDFLMTSANAEIKLNDPLYAMIFTKGGLKLLEKGAPKLTEKGKNFITNQWRQYINGFREIGVKRALIKKRDTALSERGFFHRLNPTDYTVSSMVPFVASFPLMEYIPSEEEIGRKISKTIKDYNNEKDVNYLSENSHLSSFRFLNGVRENLEEDNLKLLKDYDQIVIKEIERQNLNHSDNEIILDLYENIKNYLLNENLGPLSEKYKKRMDRLKIQFARIINFIELSGYKFDENTKKKLIINNHNYLRSISAFIDEETVGEIIEGDEVSTNSAPKELRDALKDPWVKKNILKHPRKKDRICYLSNYLSFKFHKNVLQISDLEGMPKRDYFIDLDSACEVIKEIY